MADKPEKATSGTERGASSSSPCYSHDADDRYSGYMNREELVGFLNGLLEAERAGARVATALHKDAGDVNVVDLMRDVQRDESRYCALLTGWIKKLGGTPSSKTGDFFEKVMARNDLIDRLSLLSRGQGWVARKLEEVLPRIRDDALHAALKEMRETHQGSIDRIDGLIGPHRATS